MLEYVNTDIKKLMEKDASKNKIEVNQEDRDYIDLMGIADTEEGFVSKDKLEYYEYVRSLKCALVDFYIKI